MTGAAARDSREITIRGVCLGAAMTVAFMSANLYLGLKTGLTFSSSIPAATISMSVLTLLGGAGILENNIVQTQASAAGTLCNVILVIPGLVFVHYWQGFPLWQTMFLCLLGGLFGVAYSVPLRRVLVLRSKLPFPEGVAAAEVLRAAPSQSHDGGAGVRMLGVSTAAAAVFSLCTTGFRLFPEQIIGTVQYGHAVFRGGGSLSLALFASGYLVRIGACLALVIGVSIAWGIAVPVLTSLHPPGTADPIASALAIWASQVRLIGAGTIAVAALWTAARLAKPMVDSFRPSDRETRTDDRTDADIPMAYVGLAMLALSIATAALFAMFAAGSPFSDVLIPFVIGVVIATVVFGYFAAAACGYMAALLGSSASPISGIGILVAMLVALCVSLTVGGQAHQATTQFVTAFTLFITSFIVTMCSITNDNLQDLKTGHMVGATPWKQQAALAIGVAIGAVTVAPVLGLLYQAYGFTDALPRAGMNAANAMAAPQAALITQITQGIAEHRLNWTMVMIGGALGVVFVAIEWVLDRRGFSLPAMTVGIGMYLPSTVVLTIALGGIVGWLTERAIGRRAEARGTGEAQHDGRHRGILVASGFFVGESVMGVLLAASDALAEKSGSLAFALPLPSILHNAAGAIVFVIALACFYASVVRPRATPAGRSPTS